MSGQRSDAVPGGRHRGCDAPSLPSGYVLSHVHHMYSTPRVHIRLYTCYVWLYMCYVRVYTCYICDMYGYIRVMYVLCTCHVRVMYVLCTCYVRLYTCMHSYARVMHSYARTIYGYIRVMYVLYTVACVLCTVMYVLYTVVCSAYPSIRLANYATVIRSSTQAMRLRYVEDVISLYGISKNRYGLYLAWYYHFSEILAANSCA